MKYFIIILTLLFAILLPKGITAQAPTGRPIPINVRTLVEERIEINEERRENIRLKIEEKEATREAAKEELKAKLEEKAQNRVRTLFGNISTRIESAISRLYTLIERMEARLAIFAEEGENVLEIQEKIDSAKILLVSAENSLVVAKTELENTITSEDPKAGYLYVKDVVKDIKLTLVDAHSILVQVIGDMKGLRVGETENI